MSAPGLYPPRRPKEKEFLWKSYPQAQDFLEQHLSRFLVPAKETRLLRGPLQETLLLRGAALAAGIRFFDLMDYIRLALPKGTKPLIQKHGFVSQTKTQMGEVFRHRDALFPLLVVDEVKSVNASGVLEIGMKVEDLEHLQRVKGYSETIEGTKESSLRKMSLVDPKTGYILTFVERKGNPYFGRDPEEVSAEDLEETRNLFGKFRDTKLRVMKDEEAAFKKTLEIVQKAIALVGKERAAYEWVETEVRYWEKRNRAATLQGDLQRSIGLGWINKDHITYRNSKKNFPKTIELLEMLGFERREELHAEEFTAQVLENPSLGVAAFVDVDPEEKKGVKTVGLWVKLHGESALSAGLHHMAARFDFVKVQEVLGGRGIRFRPPFSYSDDLKQMFTEGELRPIPETLAGVLYREGMITEAQRREYVTRGALYTHLENIQRGNGFKGFHPKSVDKTIRDTGRTLRLKGKS